MQYREIFNKVIIEAIQWTGKNERVIFDFLTNNTKINSPVTLKEDTFRIDLVNGGCQVGNLIIKTPDGEIKTDIGGYIIKNTKGEFYPCKENMFLKTYEILL